MAAYASLLSLMRVIHDLETHPSPPTSLDKQLLDSITQRVTYFEEFLHSYHSPFAGDDEEEKAAADPLEMRIAAAAHAAEDAIEYHIVNCISPPVSDDEEEEASDPLEMRIEYQNNKVNSANRCFGILQSVIEEMDSIQKAVMVDVYKQKKKKVSVVYDQVAVRNFIPPDETTLVGPDTVLLEIMEKLAGGQLDFQVIPIVGMGGIGKTFLAKAIYAKPLIKERFDISAWATISQNYDTREILCELLSQSTNRKKEQLSGKSVDELGLELHKYLFSRRFLIVMDDMWSIDSWDKIQRFFPNNCNGSRVLVTTRLLQLSSQLNNNDYSLRMSFLDEASSWELFSKTVFGEKISTSCPLELKEIGEKIVDNCRGLPLSIAVVGGLLKKTEATRASWESLRDNFTSVVNMDNDKHCLRLLKLSYDHLPVYLKPCFLFMGVFEEDERIHVSRLVQLLASEGFLKPTNGEALETTARGFLQDLVDRNLILIAELGSTGSLRFCKMHDLVRDMCLKEGQKQGFYHVMGQSNPHQGMNAQRRVLIPEHTPEEKVLRDELRFMPRTRSIICEHSKVPLCRNLVLLRSLQAHTKTIRRCKNEICLNSLVFRYVNLRHLAIKAPAVSVLPSITRLWNLHTLIVSYQFLFEPTLVADFWKMPQFRHIEFDTDYARLSDPPKGDAVVIMENLHTIKGVRNLKCSEDVVKRIPNIKRLKLQYNRCDFDDDEDEDADVDVNDDEDVYFVGNLKYLSRLEFLSVHFLPVGRTSPMQKITFPHSLKKLSLYMEFEFEWDDMLEKIGSLPLLEKLQLSAGRFGKGKWEIGEEQFPSLVYLEVFLCEGLVKWTASEEDSTIFPRLEHLLLGNLTELKGIPFELGNIDTLKSIKLTECGEDLVKSAKEMFDEQVELQGGEDELSFHVHVTVTENQQHLLNLAAPKFLVKGSIVLPRSRSR